MNATETASLKGLLANIRRDGTTILLIEHDMKLVMSVCDRVPRARLRQEDRRRVGRRRAEGPEVIEAYLGGEVLLNLKGGLMSSSNALLELSRVEIAYGGIQAVKGHRPHVDKGELVCLIGTNGAGKTTTLKGITGLQPVKDGAIRYAGENVTGRPCLRARAQGLAMVPEGPRRVRRAHRSRETRDGCVHPHRFAAIREDVERVFALFPRLKERRRQTAGHALRRRAADARDGPRADVEAEAPAAGRAVDGPRTAHGAESVRDGAQRYRPRGSRFS
jgi:ABC-type branched-subunit amino acid transport system ATPase component